MFYMLISHSARSLTVYSTARWWWSSMHFDVTDAIVEDDFTTTVISLINQVSLQVLC
jgi:hypothetical protein